MMLKCLVIILLSQIVLPIKWGWYPPDGPNNQQEGKDSLGIAGDSVIRTFPTVPFVTYQSSSTPSPRAISNEIGSLGGSNTNARSTTPMLEAWGQFITHDILKIQAGEQSWPIPVPQCDAVYDPDCGGDKFIKFARSKLVGGNPVNEVTTWLDGSCIYGSKMEISDVLRSYEGGLLKVSNSLKHLGEFPPLVSELEPAEVSIVDIQNFNNRDLDGKMFVCGDRRCNQNPLVLSMNILFLREHNRVARQLAKTHPDWDDTKLFHRARRYVIGEIQKVTFEEYFYWLLGGRPFPEDCSTYDPNVDPRINVFYAAVTSRFAHSSISKHVKLVDTIFNGEYSQHFDLDRLFFEPEFFSQFNVGALWAGMTATSGNSVDTHYDDAIRNNLFKTRNKINGFDLLSIDIQRARDLGIPNYNQMRTIFDLDPVESWVDLIMYNEGSVTPLKRDQFSKIFTTPELADPLIIGLAEAKVTSPETISNSDHSSLGSLFQASYINQWKRLITGDRFWYSRNLHNIEDEALPSLASRNLAQIIRDNLDHSIDIPDNVFRIGPLNNLVDIQDPPYVPLTRDSLDPTTTDSTTSITIDDEVPPPFTSESLDTTTTDTATVDNTNTDFIPPLTTATSLQITTLATGTPIPQPISPNQNWVPTTSLGGGCTGANGFPASPRTIIPFTFEFVDPPFSLPKPVSVAPWSAELNGRKVEYHEIDIVNQDIQIFIPGRASMFYTYKLPELPAGTAPGPTIEVCRGVITIVRFNNLLEGKDNRYVGISLQTPYLGTRGPGPDICSAGFTNPWPVSIHHHGSASIAPWDGWADDITFSGCGKNYIYPNNRPATTWYHDHAISITSDNAYLGLASQYWIIDCCGSVQEQMPQKPYDHPLIIRDIVFDDNNQLLYDKLGAHKTNLYGDHILVNGRPWPVMHVEPRQYRFRGLVANPSRPFRLEFTDQLDSYFLIIASDGGFLEKAVKTHTLRMHVAERWEMIIDFAQPAFAGLTEVILYNQHPFDTPHFCFTHLVMKFIIDLPLTPGRPAQPIFEGMSLEEAPVFPQPANVNPKGPFLNVPSRPLASPLVEDDWLVDAQNPNVPARRNIKFHRNGGIWVVTTTDLLSGNVAGGGPQTWDSTYNTANGSPLPPSEQWTLRTNFPEHITAEPITNSMEIWEIENGGGGWFHPIHIHLVDFILAHRSKGDAVQVVADGQPDGLAVYERKAAKDVVFLGPGEKLRVVARWGPESGHYMMHCHNLVHEDNDMLVAFFTRGNRLIFDPKNRTFGGLDLPDEPGGINAVLIEPLSDRSQPISQLAPVTIQWLKDQLARNLYRGFYPPEQFQQGYPVDWKGPPYNSQTLFTPPAENPYEVNYLELDTCPAFSATHPPGFYGK